MRTFLGLMPLFPFSVSVDQRPLDAAMQANIAQYNASIGEALSKSPATAAATEQRVSASASVTFGEASKRSALDPGVLQTILRRSTAQSAHSRVASLWGPSARNARGRAAIFTWMRHLRKAPHEHAKSLSGSLMRNGSAPVSAPHAEPVVDVAVPSRAMGGVSPAASPLAHADSVVSRAFGAALAMSVVPHTPLPAHGADDGGRVTRPATSECAVTIDGRRLGRPRRGTGTRIMRAAIVSDAPAASRTPVFTGAHAPPLSAITRVDGDRNGGFAVTTEAPAASRRSLPADLKSPDIRFDAESAVRMNRSRAPRRDQAASSIASRDLFAVPATHGLATDASDMVRQRVIGSSLVHLHYARHEGKLVFAGWDTKVHTATRLTLPDALSHTMGAPVMRAPDPFAVLGLGSPGGESAFKLPLIELDGDVFDERIMAIIRAQLKDGPASMGDSRHRDAAGAMMTTARAPHGDELDAPSWSRIVQHALTAAVRHAALFDERGMRAIDDIHADAARVLLIDVGRFIEWEEHFAVDAIGLRLFDAGMPQHSQTADVHAELMRAVERHLSKRAAVLSPLTNAYFAISREDESKAHTIVARASLLTHGEERTGEIAASIASLGRYSKALAGRILALILAHSDINEPGNAGSFAPRWSTDEIAGVVAAIMKGEVWDVVSHRSFRHYLTPSQNVFVNRAIHHANYASSIERIGSVDVAALSDNDFWKLVDSTGQTDTIFQDAIRRMMLRDIEVSPKGAEATE